MDRTHVVYRCYDARGVLLYVGRTSDLRKRSQRHNRLTPWWSDVVRITQTRPMTRAASRRFERMTIRTEHPLHNVKMMMSEHGTETRYQWFGCRCQLCRTAHGEHQRRFDKQRAAALTVDPSLAAHGRVSTYRNWGCRCDECRDAQSKAWRIYKDNRAVGA